MARPASSRPTEVELEIFKVLWAESPMPVSDIRKRLADGGRKSAHTSVLTILNIMVDKGYLEKKKTGKSFQYWPLVSEADISQLMLGDVVDRLFNGSAKHLVLSLLDNEDLPEDELVDLRKLINRKMRERKS